MIPFNRPTVAGNEKGYIRVAIENRKFSAGGEFSKTCARWLERKFDCKNAFLTASSSGALEMAAILADIHPGDEVIMPSYASVLTANAFALRGAQIIFVDIRPDTMNIDETLIEAAVTNKTKAIAVVHYAGAACEMGTIQDIAKKHRLLVIEDASQAIMGTYRGQALGTIGDFGIFSFHETDLFTSGEGGALLVNNDRFIERAEVIHKKGTNGSQFSNDQAGTNTWIDVGASFSQGELNAAFLYAQLENSYDIYENRMNSWHDYAGRLGPLAKAGNIELPNVPEHCRLSGHMFYIKARNRTERMQLIDYLTRLGITALRHYEPLHLSPAGKQFGHFHGEDRFTTTESERLLRLPMYYALPASDIEYITDQIGSFYQ